MFNVSFSNNSTATPLALVESKLMQLPREGVAVLGCPPIITHTAATPQSSPHATLDPRADDLNRLTPVMAILELKAQVGTGYYESIWMVVKTRDSELL